MSVAITERDPDERARAVVDVLPLPALVTRDEVCVAANAAYFELTQVDAGDVLGRPVEHIIAERVVAPDRQAVEHAGMSARGTPTGDLWCRIRDGRGHAHAVRVVWRTLATGERCVVFFDAEPEAFGREFADSLARAAGALAACATEKEVLERAADALSEHGLTATVLLIDEGNPLLRYGPTRSPNTGPGARMFERARPARAILEAFNPRFSERRAAFFQDGIRLVMDAYPEPLAAELAARLPSGRMVQAPLFVDQRPYGAVVVTGALLTPLLVGAIELFAELVARAIEHVRYRLERVERERLAALGEAAAVMAHEVRNPVAALLNAAALLGRGELDASSRQAVTAIIAEEAVRLERLVEDLLALGRPLLARPRPVELESIAAEAIALMTRRHDLAPGRVEIAASPSPVLASADGDLLQLAVVNVVRNAVQSTPARGRVVVSFEVGEGACAAVVEDSGPGFSEEVMRRLCEPFFTTRATGTGMGLAVVRRVLDAMGGRIDVGRSSALGGARVALWLPSGAE